MRPGSVLNRKQLFEGGQRAADVPSFTAPPSQAAAGPAGPSADGDASVARDLLQQAIHAAYDELSLRRREELLAVLGESRAGVCASAQPLSRSLFFVTAILCLLAEPLIGSRTRPC